MENLINFDLKDSEIFCSKKNDTQNIIYTIRKSNPFINKINEIFKNRIELDIKTYFYEEDVANSASEYVQKRHNQEFYMIIPIYYKNLNQEELKDNIENFRKKRTSSSYSFIRMQKHIKSINIFIDNKKQNKLCLSCSKLKSCAIDLGSTQFDYNCSEYSFFNKYQLDVLGFKFGVENPSDISLEEVVSTALE
jgi:hypothetical protein